MLSPSDFGRAYSIVNQLAMAGLGKSAVFEKIRTQQPEPLSEMTTGL